MKAWRLCRQLTIIVITALVFFPLFVQAEVVRQFGAEYHIDTDGSVRVVETIVYDFEDASRHGIYRTLSKEHNQPASSFLKTRTVKIKDVKVIRNSYLEPFTITESDRELEIKIGSPDEYLSGSQLYQVEYVLEGSLNYGSEGTELYWNATGNRWTAPLEKVNIAVTGVEPGTLSDANDCYQGKDESTIRCDNIVERGDNLTVFVTTNVRPGEGVTIAQALNKDTVEEMVVENYRLNWLWIGLTIVVLVVVVYLVYRIRTINKPDTPIIAQYEPYRGILPMYSGVIFDGRLDPHDISAGLVYLAEQGFLKIKKTEKKVFSIFTVGDYEITLLKPIKEAPNEASKSILSLVFGHKNDNLLFSLVNFKKLETDDTSAVGSTINLSDLTKHKTKNAKTLKKLRKDFKKQLLDQGYFESASINLILLVVLLVSIPAVFILNFFGSFEVFINIIIFGLVIVIALSGKVRTRLGYEAKNHLLGFKDFLSVTDEERYKFHNAPDKNPETFMKYLPYAIAFKVEKEWAKVFEDVTMPEPEWYEDAGGGVFTASAFTKDMGSFSSSFSNSSGTSGSSGGGSAGGGGGGGGGGSW